MPEGDQTGLRLQDFSLAVHNAMITVSNPRTHKAQTFRIQTSQGGAMMGARMVQLKVGPDPVEGGQADCRRVRGCAYLARFQTAVTVPPPDAAGTVNFSSSPVTVNGRFCSVPSQLGNVGRSRS